MDVDLISCQKWRPIQMLAWSLLKPIARSKLINMMRTRIMKRLLCDRGSRGFYRSFCKAGSCDPFAGPVDTEAYTKLEEMGIFDEELRSQTSLISPSLLRKHIVLIQPILKRIPKSVRKTTTELEVVEAKALVDTIGSHWKLCDTLQLSTTVEKKKLLFNKGCHIEHVDLRHERKMSGYWCRD